MLPGYEQMFLRFMRGTWHAVNRDALHGRLRPPVFSLISGRRRYGSWQADTRTLSLHQDLFLRHSEVEVVEILKHEMAHQAADELLGASQVPGEKPHGSAFRYACELLGIQHHARYSAGAKQEPPVVGRIRKLLALAESSNQHEAESAMTKARELMDRYECDLDISETGFHYQYVGKPIRRRGLPVQLLAGLLTRFFHVEVIWIPSLLLVKQQKVWLLEACGTRTNLDVATYVHDFLVRELEVRWLDLRRRNPVIKGKIAKRDFQVGLLKGLAESLAEKESPQKANDSKYALVEMRRGKLRDFFGERHPSTRSGRKSSYRLSASFEAGRQQGREMDIRKGVKKGGERQAFDHTKRLVGGR